MDPLTRHRTLQFLGLADERSTPHHIPGTPYKYRHGWIPVTVADLARWARDLSDKQDLVAAAESGAKAVGPVQYGTTGRTHTVLGDFGNGTEHLVTTYLGDDAERYADSDQLASSLARSIGAPAPRILRIAPDRTMSDLVDGPTWFERQRQILTDERGYKRTPGGGPWQAKARRDLQRQRDDMLGSDAATRIGLLDLLTGTDIRDPGTIVLGPDGPVAIQSENGWTLAVGRTPVRTEVPRQPIPGIKLPKGMKLVDVSHEIPHPGATPPRPSKADIGDGLVMWQAFARGGGWLDNPLTTADVAYVRAQLDAARPEFEGRGRLDWWQFASDRLEAIAPHATGTVDLFAPAA